MDGNDITDNEVPPDDRAVAETIARMEEEFGQKRAKFMELFKQKEDDLGKVMSELSQVKEDRDTVTSQLENLKAEIEGIKTAAAISEQSKQDEIAGIQRQCQEEMASLQRIMTENITSQRIAASEKAEQERARWLKNQERLESEVAELKSKLSQEREGFLGNMAKTLQKKVATTVGSSNATDAETLEDDMKRAKESAEMMRSLVMPLEEEIFSLKSKLRDAMEKVRRYRNPQDVHDIPPEGDNGEIEANLDATGSKTSLDSNTDVEEKVKDLQQLFENEKSARTDLEMYVSVLQTQKAVQEEEADKLRKEIKEVCQILVEERRESNDLKRTWQMANDQFLEGQRLMMMDMRRMESVLTAEQQRQISDLTKKDADREAQEKRVKDLEQKREEEEKKRTLSDTSPGGGSQTSLVSTDAFIKLDDELSSSMPRSQSQQSFGLTSPDKEHHHAPESRVQLTELQQKSLTDPTPENAASEKLFASAKSPRTEHVSTVGRRLVSEKEWQMLQQEMKSAREKLGRPCDMCNNYEAQLQEAQEGKKRADAQVRTFERQLDGERQRYANQEKFTAELQEKLDNETKQAEIEISTLESKVLEAERFLQGLQAQYNHSQNELTEQLSALTHDRENVQKELLRLQADNDSLVGKHSKHSQQLQEECINLPDSMEEMQLLLLKYREEIIQAKVGKEHAEDTKHSEVMFLKDQVRAEQQERNTMEETLSQEITQLQEDLAMLQSVKSELERESKVRAEVESRCKELDSQMKAKQAQSKQLIGGLQGQLEKTSLEKNQLEQQCHELRKKVSSLQKDLEDGEAVQRDFVKLSQTLQMQLEQIRGSEQEVRWQHDEDVDECNHCKQAFSGPRKKNHCRHCGRIFCHDCLPKTVPSGPNQREARVCGVCHTILVSDATPYFSTDPPPN